MKASVLQVLISPSIVSYMGDAALAEEFIGGDRTDNENGRLSRLELAHGGTLFLEKIEYLAVELQSALLQVIKQGLSRDWMRGV